jgi:hypothetical protein
MGQCPKCHKNNEEGLTRCAFCKAILPVKLGSESAVRYERVPKTAQTTGVNCPSCGFLNPYTRLRCRSCNALLSGEREKSWRDNLWVYVGAAVMIALLVVVLVKAL